MPKRIQMSRQKPWRADNPEAVIVSRPSRWGNPFAVGKETTVKRYPSLRSMPILEASVIPRDASEAVRLFGYLFSNPTELNLPHAPALSTIQHHLKGRDLACWCPLDQPCHADVLLTLANGGA